MMQNIPSLDFPKSESKSLHGALFVLCRKNSFVLSQITSPHSPIHTCSNLSAKVLIGRPAWLAEKWSRFRYKSSMEIKCIK